MFNLIRKIIKPEKTVSELTRDIESVMRYQIELHDINSELEKSMEFYESRIKQLEDNSRVMSTRYRAMAQKLHAYCVLLGDLNNQPPNCLRDRVSTLEDDLGFCEKDVSAEDLAFPEEINNG
jgi:hypothetical protein